MGYRKITEIEFKYIKELFKKYKGKAKVASIAGRSPSTVSYIKEAKDYAEYVEIRPGGAKHGKNKKAKPSTKKSSGDIDTAILKELTALRKAMFKLNGTIEKFNKFMLNPIQVVPPHEIDENGDLKPVEE